MTTDAAQPIADLEQAGPPPRPRRQKPWYKKCCAKILPFTCILSVYFIETITWTYFAKLTPALLNTNNEISDLLVNDVAVNSNKELAAEIKALQARFFDNTIVFLQVGGFFFFTLMIHIVFYFRLILPIPCTQIDPGYVDEKLENEILHANGLSRYLIDHNVLAWNEVETILTERYLKRQGLLPMDGSETTPRRDLHQESNSVQLRSIPTDMQLLKSSPHEFSNRRQRIKQAIKDNYGFSDSWDITQDFIRYRYCKSCDRIKPPRAHHCSICQKCVTRMDHHCPWVGRCVGHGNYRFFYQFLMYTTFGCAYVGWSISSLISNIV